MDYILILITIIVAIGVVTVIYLHNQKKSYNNENYNNYVQPQQEQYIAPEPKIDWSIHQHIGWLQTEQQFNNLNLYFNQTNATFCALPLNHNQYYKEFIQLGGEIPKDGTMIQMEGINYTVELEKIEE